MDQTLDLLAVTVANTTGNLGSPSVLAGAVTHAAQSWPGAPIEIASTRDVLFETPPGTDAYPVAAMRSLDSKGYDVAFVVVYRRDATFEHLDLVRLHPDESTPPTPCVVGTTSRPLAGTLTLPRVFGADGLQVDMVVTTPPTATALTSGPLSPSTLSDKRLFVLLTGGYWNDVFEVVLSRGTLDAGVCSLPAPTLAGRIDLTLGGAAPKTLTAASVDRRGQRLVAIVEGQAYLADVRAPVEAGTPYDLVELKVDTSTCNPYGLADISATTRGALLAGQENLCEVSLPLGFAGARVAETLWRAPSGSSFTRALIAPNEAETWAFARATGPNAPLQLFRSARRYAMGSGATTGEISFADRQITDAVFTAAGDRLLLLCITDWVADELEWMTSAGASVCVVK